MYNKIGFYIKSLYYLNFINNRFKRFFAIVCITKTLLFLYLKYIIKDSYKYFYY